MRVLAGIAFVLSTLFYVCVAVVILHPLYVFGWSEGWRWVVDREFEWSELAILAALLLFGTMLLGVGLSLTHKGCPPV